MGNSKKGNAAVNVLYMVVIIFVFVIVTAFAYRMNDELNTEIQADDSISTEAKAVMAQKNASMPTTFDYAAIMIFGLLWMGALLSAFLLDTHPAFMMLGIIVALLLIMVPPYLANFYEDAVTHTDIDTEDVFPLTTFMMKHLLEYYIVVVFTSILVLYGKGR